MIDQQFLNPCLREIYKENKQSIQIYCLLLEMINTITFNPITSISLDPFAVESFAS